MNNNENNSNIKNQDNFIPQIEKYSQDNSNHLKTISLLKEKEKNNSKNNNQQKGEKN